MATICASKEKVISDGGNPSGTDIRRRKESDWIWLKDWIKEFTIGSTKKLFFKKALEGSHKMPGTD